MIVLNKKEIDLLFGNMHGLSKLMGQLIYGSGLRHFECLKLRIKDINFDLNRITVISGKGDKDRITLLPGKIVEPLVKHINEIKKLYYEARRFNIPGVELPYALERKYLIAGVY